MFEYRILPEHQLTLIWNRGETSVSQCVDFIKKVQADPDHSPDYDVITDLTELITAFSSQDILEMVQVSESLLSGNRNKKNAIIANTDRIYAPSRMYEQFSNGTTPFKTGAFRDWISALKWLDKDPADLAMHLNVDAESLP
ncbi:hypothetical protein DSLASN_46270 [Desulfoluna limicola]|uniref:Uncharacterized protein n=1 Tax=Desulfoluna limicola TaxID=2810562 RepID=A0ABM7PN93_9BACT|nr:hypothetical protein [Desulfoluna limicola]BCS98995.1 hypothetical protein DSLASN_46270 [Desulfoluna limicola]